MSVLLLTLSNKPLLPLNVEKEENKKPYKKKQKKETLVSSIFFFLSSFFEIYYLCEFSFSEIIFKNPKTIILDLSYSEYLGETKLNNYYRVVTKIKETLPNTKIITLCEKEIEGVENLLVWKTEKQIFKKLKITTEKKETKIENICVVTTLKEYLRKKEKYKEKEIEYFYFVEYEIEELGKLNNISYKINMPLEKIKPNIERLTKSGCVKIFSELVLCDERMINEKEIIEINKQISLEIKIIPKNISNIKIIETINFLEKEEIKYIISKNQTTNTKQELLFSLMDAFKENKVELENIKKRIELETYSVSENQSIENIINVILEMDKEHMDVYLDFVHIIDGYFTIEEIIKHLVKLHKRHTQEEIATHVKKCVLILEKKKLITKNKDTKKYIQKQKLNFRCVFPQREEMQLIYSGFERGYFMLNTKHKTEGLEKISQEIFFFFLFSKGIYYIREIAEKMHLLFGEGIEFSKENYLKTTNKIYKIFKRYKLCK